MRYYELLFEAAYDSMITSMLSKYPDYTDAINWAKQSDSLAKRQDRVVWYLRQVRGIIESADVQNKIEVIEKLQQTLDHYLLQEIPKINSYIFSNDKNIDVTFNELKALEKEFHEEQKKNKPVPIKKGDYKLIEYPDGSNWWFVDRAYCRDEGRSGHHCGNVEGQRKFDQRILSYRDKNGNVLLTFILHSDGSLGEMKARYNRKPEPKYHKVIVDLLSTNLIKNIKSGGFLPENNFSISDLEAKNMETLYKTKPKLIYDSIIKDPTIILKLPKEILNNQKFVDIVSRSKKGKDIINLVRNPSTINWIMYLLDDGDKSTKLKAWYSAPLAAKKATNELLVDNIYNNIISFDYEDEDYDINTDIKWPKEFKTPDIGKKVLDRLLTGDETWWDPVLLQVIKIAYPNLNTDQSEQDDLLSYFASKKSHMSITTGKWEESTKKFFDEHPNLKNEFFDRLLLLLTRPQNQSFEYFAPRFSKAVGKKLDVDNISVKDFLYVLNKIPGPIVGDMNRGDYHLIEYFNTKNLAKAISLLDEEKLRNLIPVQYSIGGNQLGYLFAKADLNATKKFIKNMQNAYQSNETTLNRFLENFLSPYLSKNKSNVDEDIIGLWYKLTNELPYRYTQYEDIIPKRVILDVIINNSNNIIDKETFIESVLKIWKNDEDVMQALRQKGVKIKDLDK